jgi:DNA repair exonuclease SbcCD ATPase subunit
MLQFKKLIVHNFGSYGHSELDLQNRGFCLVSGQNNYKKDNALSNGAGKSFLWSAICYALTGETINGIKTNLKNINIEADDCYVQLDFLYEKDLFSIIRQSAPKSELRLFKNDVDLSGKGIRESERKLLELLPDITKDLIASTIIIGQGMPNRFSSFSPSGRKELLEKLTKSDFMIEDLKSRIQTRQQELSAKVQEYKDSLIANNTQLNIHMNEASRLRAILNQQAQPEFDELLKDFSNKITQIELAISNYTQTLTQTESDIEAFNQSFIKLSSEKTTVSSEELNAYTSSHSALLNKKAELKFKYSELQKEIKKLQEIKEVCPTCGQRLPNVIKPSTISQEAELVAIEKDLVVIEADILKCEQQHQIYLTQIEDAFRDELSTLESDLASTKQLKATTKAALADCQIELDTAKSSYNKVLYDKQNWHISINNQQKELEGHEAEIARLTNLIGLTMSAKEDYSNRLAIIKKMDNLIRRDFRGYLLTNVIEYINIRAKEYCETVFGTRDLSLTLNGNALDITYCNKAFDGLSGGEKQRVDLLLQLAIRDMLTTYLGLSANILVLDEITDFLDKKSCQAVMALLEKELQTIESVFIVSHHAEELELPIDSEIKIVKNENGISELL